MKEEGFVLLVQHRAPSITHTDTHHRACFSFWPENRKRFSLVRFQPFTIDSLLMFHATTALTAGHVYLVVALWPLLTEKTWV